MKKWSSLYCVILCACEYIKIGRHSKWAIVMTSWVRRAGVIYHLLCICAAFALHCESISDIFQFSKERKASPVFPKDGEISRLWLGLPPPQGGKCTSLYSLCRDVHISEHMCAHSHSEEVLYRLANSLRISEPRTKSIFVTLGKYIRNHISKLQQNNKFLGLVSIHLI